MYILLCILSCLLIFIIVNEKTSPITRHILEKIKKTPTGFEHVFMSKNIRRMVVLACKYKIKKYILNFKLIIYELYIC